MLLSGCIKHTEQPTLPAKQTKSDVNRPVSQVQPIPSIPSIPSQIGPIEYQNPISQHEIHVHHYDWNGTIQPMVSKMLQEQRVTEGKMLLVDSINNRTNGLLNTDEATKILHNALANNGKFTLVSLQQTSIAKQQLGLSLQDSLNSRNKAICVARKIGAQYVLYSNATDNVNSPFLHMQLMLVHTGEIIWSGISSIRQFQSIIR